ncbi:MAG: Ankyrin repeats (3 copies) [bacterium ADurb.Bin429]|nr:MAG: Ankyrin repeats (3 copies) [bacterium ADurb.Bin429]
MTHPAGYRAASRALREAAATGRLDLVRELLQHGANPNQRDRLERTPLLLASEAGSLEVASALLAAGADVNRADQWGRTPLHEAAAEGQVELVRMLIDHGAALAVQEDVLCMTPLHFAALGGHTAIVDLLLAAGADTTAVDTYGLTAYALAVEHDETAVIAVMQAYHPHLDRRECILVGSR